MSKHVKLLAGALLIAGVMAAPVGARAQHHHGGGGGHHGGGGGHHGGGGGHYGGSYRGGGHYGGSYHGGGHYGGGYRGGYRGGGGVYLGFGVPGFYGYGDPDYYADPYYYDEPPPPPPPDCEWMQIRVWRYGHWVWRDVQRCY